VSTQQSTHCKTHYKYALNSITFFLIFLCSILNDMMSLQSVPMWTSFFKHVVHKILQRWAHCYFFALRLVFISFALLKTWQHLQWEAVHNEIKRNELFVTAGNSLAIDWTTVTQFVYYSLAPSAHSSIGDVTLTSTKLN